MKRSLILLLLITLSCSALLSCKKEPTEPPTLQSTMMSNYDVTAKLFDYVWDPVAFAAPRNSKNIKKYLSQLEKNLHNTELSKDLPDQDPTISITLSWFQDLMKDAAERFETGNVDYANWRLRSMTSACIACHSRKDTDKSFVGSTPIPQGDSVEYKFAAAQFLFATRQFNKASDSFYQLATSLIELESGRSYALEVLKEWLVVEIRVLKRHQETKSALELLLAKISSEDPRIAELLERWISDLEHISTLKIEKENEVKVAYQLLKDALLDPQLANEEHLVKSLKASAILHDYLESEPARDAKKSAMFLLAVSYQHLPVDSLDIYKRLYLEKCIRLFPQTDEARQAYVMYHQLVESENTGSGGLHLEPEEQEKLKILRETAFGAPQMTIPDTFDPIKM